LRQRHEANPSDDVSEIVLDFPTLAAAIVSEVAPRELELLPDVTTAWRAGEFESSTRGTLSSGVVGFGLDPDVLTTIIYPLLTGVAAGVLGDTATRWQRRRRRPLPPRTATRQNGIPKLSQTQIEEFRDICFAHAVAAGVTEDLARLISDALYGRLRLTLDQSQDDPDPPPGHDSDTPPSTDA
jgi:hypothetical protein